MRRLAKSGFRALPGVALLATVFVGAVLVGVVFPGAVHNAEAATLSVPSAYASIQAALDVAGPGDRVEVAAGVYSEKLVLPSSGSQAGGWIELTAATPGVRPVLDGVGVAGCDMILVPSRSWVRVEGFEIRNNLGVSDCSGIRITGSGSHIELFDNVIHDIRGNHAMGITVYATEATPISELVIDGNEIYDCEPANSEALTLNGNVDGFAVTNNIVRDVNNIGIDFIGGETDIQPNPSLVTRNGVCRGNEVYRANSNYGGGWAGGIYVDGGSDIIIEGNIVGGCDLGIEIAAENAGTVTTGITVRNNFIYANNKAGLVFGGYASSVGRANGNSFTNNSTHGNDTSGQGLGELWIQFAENNTVRGNVFSSTSQNVLIYSEGGAVGNQLDYNLWYAPGGQAAAEFNWQGTPYAGFNAFVAGSGQGANSLFADPLYLDAAAGDLHLDGLSPARDAGDPAFTAAAGETDIDGSTRVSGAAVDLGADEVGCGDGTEDPGEQCDDGNQVDGDGCDSNCTFTACGNSVLTVGEQCDDGGTEDGDCCSASCQLDAPGVACDDDSVCSAIDSCDGAGACIGLAEPAAGCFAPVKIDAARFDLSNRDGSSRDKAGLKWKSGEAHDLAALGDPTVATAYTLCVYDQSAGSWQTALEATIPAGGSCAGSPCWKAIGSKGFKYKDRASTAGGVQKLILKSGAEGRTKFILKARGGAIDLPAMPLAQDSTVAARLSNDAGSCWQADFTTPATANSASRFKDKGN